MHIITCPHCKMDVALRPDGTCPSCRSAIDLGSLPEGGAEAVRSDLETADAAAQASLPRESFSAENHRPLGLTILAAIQFFFAAAVVMSLLWLYASPDRRAQMERQVFRNQPYVVVASSISFALLTVSAFGYLSQNRITGYWGGNLLAVGSVANTFVYGALQGFAQFPLQLPSLIYPIVLFFLLNIYYRRCFN